MKQPPDEAWRARCKRLADLLIEPLRAVARDHGYALGVHGTLERDIDLIAAPWSNPLSPARVLAEAIQARARELNHGIAECIDEIGASNPEYFRRGSPCAKPHGRLSWSYHLGGGPYIDLSVLAPGEDPPLLND